MLLSLFTVICKGKNRPGSAAAHVAIFARHDGLSCQVKGQCCHLVPFLLKGAPSLVFDSACTYISACGMKLKAESPYFTKSMLVMVEEPLGIT